MNFAGCDLNFITGGFAALYCGIAVFMWVCSLLFSIEYMAHYEHKKRYYIFMVATWFATMGVLASGDFLTTFIFFEIMSFTSYLLVIHEETPGPMRAGETYLAVAVIGGMVMLMGLFLLYDAIGTVRFAEISAGVSSFLAAGGSKGRLYASGICILIGFGAKAGMFPIHIWLPKAHPIAPAPASALLSGILTKTGIFGIIIISTRVFFEDQTWGTLLSVLGAITMFLGAFLALFSIDLKRTLACSSVSQIGFILIGISMLVLLGHENALASMGTILHMVNHSTIKLLLFSSAGAIYMKRHTLNLNQLRGYGRNKPWLMVLFLVGATSIAGIPGTSGYISKTLLHESIVEYIEHAHHLGQPTAWFSALEWIFLISGGMTLCYMTKLFICIFVEKNSDPALAEKFAQKGPYMTPLSGICLTAPAVVLFCMGIMPHQIMDRIAELARPFLCGAELEHTLHYFSLTNIKGSAISITIGALLYIFVMRNVFMKKTEASAQKEYVNLWPAGLDLEDRVYRPFIAFLMRPGILGVIDAIPDRIYAELTKPGILGAIDALPDRIYAQLIKPGILGAIDAVSDAFVAATSGTIFRQWTKEDKRFSFADWYHNAESGKAFKAFHEAYIEVRDSMSFGLLIACAGLTVILLVLILK